MNLRRAIQCFILSAFVLGATHAGACSFDTDCQPGAKCKKAKGDIYGVCYGGISPGNKNDREPVRAPLDINQTYGNTCQFDVDCGPGSVCAKSPPHSLNGVCLKKRAAAR